MRINKVKSLWQEGKAPTVAWLDTADTYVAESMANVGFDALVLDMQHGMAIGPDRAALWLQAVSTTDTVPIVRVPWNEPFFIQWVLDAGAYGVIVPLVNSREEAAKAGGILPAVLSGSSETAVNAFLTGKIKFTAMAGLIKKALAAHKNIKAPNLAQLLSAEKSAKEFVEKEI